MSPNWAYKNLGGVVGVRLIHELRGKPSITMKEELTEKRMIATTRMFGKPVTELNDLKEAVATYVSRAAEKLRRQQSAARVVTVFVVPSDRDLTKGYVRDQSISAHVSLPAATALTQDLIKPALQVVEGLYESGKTYKKAGVMLSGIVPDESVQGNLFNPVSEGMNRYLMDTIDNVNFSMRDDVLKFGSSGIQKNWKMRQELRSGRYSTRWEELREVR
jgi:DNA polymerase V